jgi:tRNA pseudouridine38-40 synthase
VRNIKLIVAYDGTDFHGFQSQPNLRTVQSELQQAIERLTGESIQITGSGRTDAGVHAWGQVVNFHTSSRIPIDKWLIAMNSVLPQDLVIRGAEEASRDFHARFDATAKTYLYQIDPGLYPDVFRRRHVWHVPYRLEIDSMRKAAVWFTGEHDFTSFCNASTPVEDKVRQIHEIRVEEFGNVLKIWVHGNGFLWNMVRILVGTLVDVGRGRISSDEIPAILAAKDRTRAGVTAPARGLTLFEVLYPKNEL